MSKVTVSIPQGTRDFNAEVVRKRQYIFKTIKSVFELYGFAPLETPAMENLETLMGKYGDEGDKLIFKVLNNGIGEEKNIAKSRAAFENVALGKNDKDLTARAFRYDLTIPFARYVAMNHTTLTMPFKRYQIQPVWRADRPQRGRYREFYQCDADVVGSNSMMNEVELLCVYTEVFKKLGIDVTIKINSRKILAALAELCGGNKNLIIITTAIDKLDKIGLEKVKEELQTKQLSLKYIEIIEKYLAINGTNKEKIETLNNLIGLMSLGVEGIRDLNYLLSMHAKIENEESKIVLDFTLARGLNYYTGCIFEITANNVVMGSIGGGGRYDDLTGTFGVPNIPGVGISFGVDRIYDVMEELLLFPKEIHQGTKVLFFNLGEQEVQKSFELMQQLRASNISCELYHENAKQEKQYKYAEKKNIPFVIIMGENELAKEKCVVKNINTGEKQEIDNDDIKKMASIFSI
jgi:histidyl-tRNA synthetase